MTRLARSEGPIGLTRSPASDERYDKCQAFRETGHGFCHRRRYGTLRSDGNAPDPCSPHLSRSVRDPVA